MSEFRNKIEKIESELELVRGRLETNDSFSHLLESVMGATAANRTDPWITVTTAHELAGLIEATGTLRRTKGLKKNHRENFDDHTQFIKEKVPELKSLIEKAQKELSEQIRPIVFPQFSQAAQLKSDVVGNDVVDRFVEEMLKVADQASNPENVKAFLSSKDAALIEKRRELIKAAFDPASGVKQTYTEIETALKTAHTLCEDLVAIVNGKHSSKETKPRSNDGLQSL